MVWIEAMAAGAEHRHILSCNMGLLTIPVQLHQYHSALRPPPFPRENLSMRDVIGQGGRDWQMKRRGSARPLLPISSQRWSQTGRRFSLRAPDGEERWKKVRLAQRG